jgi:hypothetical protein
MILSGPGTAPPGAIKPKDSEKARVGFWNGQKTVAKYAAPARFLSCRRALGERHLQGKRRQAITAIAEDRSGRDRGKHRDRAFLAISLSILDFQRGPSVA